MTFRTIETTTTASSDYVPIPTSKQKRTSTWGTPGLVPGTPGPVPGSTGPVPGPQDWNGRGCLVEI